MSATKTSFGDVLVLAPDKGFKSLSGDIRNRWNRW